MFLEVPPAVDCERPVGAAVGRCCLPKPQQRCQAADVQNSSRQGCALTGDLRSVHFPAELAAPLAVCMLRWLPKEGTGRASIQLRRFRGAKAGRKNTNFDICCSLQVSLIIAWRDVKVHRHNPELEHPMAASPPVPPLSHRQEWQTRIWHTRKSWFSLLSRRECAVIQPQAAISGTRGREGGNSSLGKECCSVGQWF